MQALEYGSRYKQEEYHYSELGIATLNASFINANRDPKKSSPAKPSDFFYFQPPNKNFTSAIANTVLQLAAEGSLPSWTVDLLPLPDLIKLKTGKSNHSPKALFGNGVLIINPVITEEKIHYSLVCLAKAVGNVTVVDKDSKKKYLVYIPEHEDDMMILDDYFKVQRMI